MKTYHYTIFSKVSELPEIWDSLSASNVFLSKNYLNVLEESAPNNMKCHFIGLWDNCTLVGIALAQFIDLNQLTTFGQRDHGLKTLIRNFIFKNFSSHVLFLGNNMLTGQNALMLHPNCNETLAFTTLKNAISDLKHRYKSIHKKIHLTSIKDFGKNQISNFQKTVFTKEYRFSTQPNMVFTILSEWKSEEDYVTALLKKYRDQYKRARKKGEGIQKRKMHLEDIIRYEKTIYNLYFHVAKNAPFNTFFLAENHFRKLKENLKDKFLFYGYFSGDTLIGFNTLIKNGSVIDTYFLGYDETIQKDKMLYLNMLYDMIGYSIKHGYQQIIFARTALEIKSSVGAKPVPMFGLLQHSNPIIHAKIGTIFNYLEPKTVWNQRQPFK